MSERDKNNERRISDSRIFTPILGVGTKVSLRDPFDRDHQANFIRLSEPTKVSYKGSDRRSRTYVPCTVLKDDVYGIDSRLQSGMRVYIDNVDLPSQSINRRRTPVIAVQDELLKAPSALSQEALPGVDTHLDYYANADSLRGRRRRH
ncbi:MAG: hypothetical protein ACMG6E_04955 [Candidatus Roizmanbacteria bacterium]